MIAEENINAGDTVEVNPQTGNVRCTSSKTPTKRERAAFVEGAAWAKHEQGRQSGELTNFAPWEQCVDSFRQDERDLVERTATYRLLADVLESVND